MESLYLTDNILGEIFIISVSILLWQLNLFQSLNMRYIFNWIKTKNTLARQKRSIQLFISKRYK